eukprot:Phypoly_transcript_06888.p1 GENE.Phypoly_transcript_06888~~Phypoly_transcript_06888.p1  ORF type:complete len:368 (+),score=48.43 Phypoly_transcript_06888:607-1710(+)
MDPTVSFVSMYSKRTTNQIGHTPGTPNLVSGKLENVKLRPAFDRQKYCGYGWKDVLVFEKSWISVPVQVQLTLKVKRSPSYHSYANCVPLQQLSYPARVGRMQITVRYNWNLSPFLFVLDKEVVDFWRSLAGRTKKKKRAFSFQIDPVEIAKIAGASRCTIDCNFADKMRDFFVKAIHIHENGWVTVPYELVFHEFDIDDGSGDDDLFNFVAASRYETVFSLLDSCAMLLLPKAYQQSKNIKKDMCSKCKLEGEAFKNCSKCMGVKYCGANCQKADWKDHKIKCNELRTIYEKRQEERRKRQSESLEEKTRRFFEKRAELNQQAFDATWDFKNPLGNLSSTLQSEADKFTQAFSFSEEDKAQNQDLP